MAERIGDKILDVLGSRIQKFRQRRGWSLDVLKNESGLSKQAIRQAEAGRATRRTIFALAAAFGQPGNRFLRPKDRDVIRTDEERIILDSFHEDFGADTFDNSFSVPWDSFRREAPWKPSEAMHAVTGHALRSLWCVPQQYRTLEAHQLRFMADGGEARRIHLLDDESADEELLTNFAAVLYRHLLLGFNVRVLNELSFLGVGLKVDCTGFAVFGNERVFFTRHSEVNDEMPVAIHTRLAEYVSRAGNCFAMLWEQSVDADQWLASTGATLTAAEKNMAAKEVECIRRIALSPDELVKLSRETKKQKTHPSERNAGAKGSAARKRATKVNRKSDD